MGLFGGVASSLEIPGYSGVDQESNSAELDSVKLKESDVLEVESATHGSVDNTALFKVYLA